MIIQQKSIYIVRLFSDLIVLIMSFGIALVLTINDDAYIIDMNNQVLLYLLVFIWVVSSRINGVYDEFRSRDFIDELLSVIRNVIVQSISAIIILFMLEDQILSRYFIIVYTLYLLTILTFEKYLYRVIIRKLRKVGRNLRSMLIVGAGDLGYDFYKSINDNPQFGYRIIGFLDDKIKDYLNGQYLGKLESLESILEKQRIDDVIIALPQSAESKLYKIVRTCENYTTRIKIIPDYFKYIPGKYNVSMFGKFPIISVREDRINVIHLRAIKRFIDISLSSILFIFIFSWLWPIIIIAIRISSKGPAFFKQVRWGRDNENFYTYKFRSMVQESSDVDANGKFNQAIKGDPRITKIGRFLRKTNLDELPQFWNVIKGEMSIVGPRPHPTPLNIESKETVSLYMLRHLVKPGITGWAQINGLRGETKNSDKMQKRINHDVWYIENWSFRLDFHIIIETIKLMIKGDPNAC